ncbi:hypothetical protein [Spirosoma radiotolerans]|uniref:Uncharacterized protein n=1 Tax=Spirosoma radiotolerans TaxID=1379870 RepID=A0A0E3V647_9BACT|nr:hypothetical protein [Spirosoma radiotolerans]AKD54216.1 hypothetical protein SD10_04155 [Spirosoma radiotolerans]
MKHFGVGLLGAILGYMIVAGIGYFLILYLSSNNHDRKMEASMTSIFFLGPVGFVIGFVVGYFWSRS